MNRQIKFRGTTLLAATLIVLLPLGLTAKATAQGGNGSAAVTPLYTIEQIAPLPGGQWNSGGALNSAGQVVGTSESVGAVEQGFVWSDGQAQALAPLPGCSFSAARNISESGVVVGDSAAYFQWHAVIWALAADTGEWRVTDLGTLGGDPNFESCGMAIADVRGMTIVVGYSEIEPYIHHAFRWRDGRMEDLGTLMNGAGSEAHDVNQDGLIVGGSMTNSWGPWHAFVYDDSLQPPLIDLGALLPHGEESVATAINERGDIVGFSCGPGSTHAVMWTRDGAKWEVTDLGTLGDEDTYPEAINERRQVVGWTWSAGGIGRAFLWQAGQMHDLNDSLPTDAPWRALYAAEDINDADQIVGTGDYSTSGVSAFLMKPAQMVVSSSTGGTAKPATLRFR